MKASRFVLQSWASRIHERLTRTLAIAAFPLLVLALVAVAAGCGSNAGGSSSSASSSSGATASMPQSGGTLKVGIQPGLGQRDPILLDAVGDMIVSYQVQEALVSLGQGMSLEPVLATEWNTADSGKTWKITLRDGVKFSNGQPFTADDVVYSIDRMRDKKLGSPLVEILSGIVSVVLDDPTHVTVNLKSANAEFMGLLTDTRAKMLSKSVADPAKEFVGTGPFMLKSYAAEDRAILVKNPAYWGKDAQGKQLPYLDEVDVIYSPDTAGQLEGLRGGSLNWIGGITAEQKQAVEADPNLKTISGDTNYCFEVNIRTDVGPGKQLAFRQALMAGTDRQALIDLADPSLMVPGNGTVVGPGYGADYLDANVPYDLTKAKALLAQAGYANGVKINLVAQAADPVPALATVWQAQMKDLGVDVSIQQVPTDVYYADKGPTSWAEAPFSVQDWGTRAVPSMYFNLALTTKAPWNWPRWHTPEFDKLTKDISVTTDPAKRSELYHRAQQILQDQVPMLNLGVMVGMSAVSANVNGIVQPPDWESTLFRTAYFTK